MTNLSQRKRENPVEKNPEPLSSTLTGDRNTKIHTKKKKKKWITLFWFRKISKIRVSTRKAIEKSHHTTMKSLPFEQHSFLLKQPRKNLESSS